MMLTLLVLNHTLRPTIKAEKVNLELETWILVKSDDQWKHENPVKNPGAKVARACNYNAEGREQR